MKGEIVDAEFRLVRPRRLFRPWALAGFCFFTYLFAGAAAAYADTTEDKAALVALVVCAAMISPTWRFFSLAGSRVSDAEAEWLAARLKRPERSEDS